MAAREEVGKKELELQIWDTHELYFRGLRLDSDQQQRTNHHHHQEPLRKPPHAARARRRQGPHRHDAKLRHEAKLQ
uniref:Uncharacterized protein n=1 Tax=Triticum urartu TaxID=4572 RepID=A0A8R7UPE6_TRIUA